MSISGKDSSLILSKDVLKLNKVGIDFSSMEFYADRAWEEGEEVRFALVRSCLYNFMKIVCNPNAYINSSNRERNYKHLSFIQGH